MASVFFCGNCVEDLSIILKERLQNNSFINIPSSDRILDRLKSLSDNSKFFTIARGKVDHQFSLAEGLV